jgi:ferredoxin-like protein FixX
MIAHYGYEDGSGEYYITINTEGCGGCEGKGCVAACPAGIFELETDDWDSDAAVVKESARNTLRAVCADCKPQLGREVLLPCEAGCEKGVIVHSW